MMHENMKADFSFLNMFSRSVAAPGIVPADKHSTSKKNSEGGFQSLLDVVSDMELPDGQSPSGRDVSAEQLSTFKDGPLRDLESKLNASQISLLTPEVLGRNLDQSKLSANVGHSLPDAKLGKSETKAIKDILLDGQALTAESAQHLSEAKGDKQEHSAEALQNWAFALSTGDVKAVDVGPSEKAAASLLQGQVKNLTSQLAGNGKSLEFSAALLMTPKDEKSEAAKLGAEKFGKKPSLDAVVVSKNEKSSGFEAAKIEVVNPKEDFSDSFQSGSKGKAFQASDFVLKSTHSPETFASTTGYRSGAGVGAGPTSALVMAKNLGQAGDKRISPEALDFVADKIQTLKDQGGGTLRVQLHPKDLGMVEIRVGMRRGQLEVKIMAEKPTTLQALNAARSELTDKLSAVAPNTVDMSQLKPSLDARPLQAQAKMDSAVSPLSMNNNTSVKEGTRPTETGVVMNSQMATDNHQHESVKSTFQNSGQSTSHDMLEMRGQMSAQRTSSLTASNLRPAQDVHVMNARDDGASKFVSRPTESSGTSLGTNGRESTANTRSAQSSESGSWARDERRSQAMDRWEELFGRKSA